MAVTMEAATRPTAGTTLDAAVTTESSRASMRASMSASGSPKPISRFSHAAPTMPMDPSMVVAASVDVVPAMSMRSWMTWMASTILSKETSFTVSAVTVMASPSTPLSLMSLAISLWVPP